MNSHETAERQTELNEILESITDGFIVLDKNANVVYWNRQAEKITGKRRDEMLRKNIWAAFPEAVGTIFHTENLRATQEQKNSRYEHYSDFSNRWYSVMLYPSPEGMTALFCDITDEKKKQAAEHENLTEQKRITAAVMEAQEKEREWISGELHDNVNQILTTVKLYIHLCLSQTGDSKELMEKSVDLLQTCISDLRNLSKRFSVPSLHKIGFENSIRELIHSIEATKQVEVRLHTTDTENLIIDNDLHVAIYRILQEQFTNILRHAAARLVNVTITYSGNALSVKIQDDGKGFDATIPGPGIGIQNMRTRAESKGGSLQIISSPGEGCTVELRFPL